MSEQQEQAMEEAPVSQADPAAQPPSILDQIITVDNLEPWSKILIYGDPGAGKTLFAASAPKPLILDCENSSRSIMDFPEIMVDCKILKILSFNDLDTVFWHLMNGDIPDVETVVIDTISELQRRNLDEIMLKAHSKDPNRNLFLPFQGDYKISTESMRKMVTMFRDLPYNLIVTAHRTEELDQGTGRRFVRPEVTPKLAATLKGVFHLQGYMTYETVDEQGNETFKNSLRVRQSPTVEAKCRYRHLPTDIENPTYQVILDAHAKSLAAIEEYKESQKAVEEAPEPAPDDGAPKASAMFTPPTSQD